MTQRFVHTYLDDLIRQANNLNHFFYKYLQGRLVHTIPHVDITVKCIISILSFKHLVFHRIHCDDSSTANLIKREISLCNKL